MNGITLADSLNFGWGRRLPIVLQSEAAECGLACLAMVLGFHDQPTPMADLRRQFGMSLRGATLRNLCRIANALALEPRPVRLEIDELSSLKLPCVLHWDLNHFVVLADVGAKDCVIHDPAVGVRRLSMKDVSKHFTGVALELTPEAGFESVAPPPRLRWRTLLGEMRGLKAALGRVFAIALGIEVTLAVAPMFMQWVVDDALVTADRDLLVTLVLAFALLLAFRTAFIAMRGWTLLAVSASVRVQGRANLFGHLLKLPTAFFEARQLGDVLSRFGSQEIILGAITTEVVEAILDGVLALFSLTLMFVFAPWLALVVLTGTVAYGLLRWVAYTPLRRASVEAITWAARRDTHLLETLRGMTTIKVFGAEAERRRGFLNLLVETVNRQLTTQNLQILFGTSNHALTGLVSLLVVWLGARRVLDHTFTVGALIAFIAYKEQFVSRTTVLINRALDLQMLRIHGERLADIVLTEPEAARAERTVEDEDPIVEREPPPMLEVRNLRFRYSEHDPFVLDGVDLKIQPGESLAIIGRSGCGKTTLLKVLASLLQPTEGKVAVDGEPLKKVGIDRYRQRIGVVMQDDQLFGGSIAENISFFAETPDQARIEECAKKAAVDEAIKAMPMGYGTLIGDMGTALSGGQKQRVLIARALYRQPNVLLLDEATSHLDVACERAVNSAIRASAITRIIVAHRPETILSADRVIVMEDGKIVDEARGRDLQRIQKMITAQAPAPAPLPPADEELDITQNKITQRLSIFKIPMPLPAAE